MMKFIETSFFSNVNEYDRSVAHEAAGGYGSRLGVFHCRMRARGKNKSENKIRREGTPKCSSARSVFKGLGMCGITNRPQAPWTQERVEV